MVMNDQDCACSDAHHVRCFSDESQPRSHPRTPVPQVLPTLCPCSLPRSARFDPPLRISVCYAAHTHPTTSQPPHGLPTKIPPRSLATHRAFLDTACYTGPMALTSSCHGSPPYAFHSPKPPHDSDHAMSKNRAGSSNLRILPLSHTHRPGRLAAVSLVSLA